MHPATYELYLGDCHGGDNQKFYFDVPRTTAPSTYTLWEEHGCTGRNELWDIDQSTVTDGVEGCASMCDADSTCVSIEWGSGKCRGSRTCTTEFFYFTDKTFDLYIKAPSAVGYVRYPMSACAGRNELWEVEASDVNGVDGCAELCDEDPTCVSFEWKTGGACKGSTSCTLEHKTTWPLPNYLCDAPELTMRARPRCPSRLAPALTARGTACTAGS